MLGRACNILRFGVRDGRTFGFGTRWVGLLKLCSFGREEKGYGCFDSDSVFLYRDGGILFHEYR